MGRAMASLLHFTAAAVATIFTMVDPFGLVPMYLAAIAGMPPSMRRRVPLKASIIAGIVVLLSGVAGREVLHLLGITLPAFSISGGALLFLVALDMIFGRPTGARETELERSEAATRTDPSVFPIAFPMIAGPGSILTVILLVELAKGDPLKLGVVIGALVLAIATCYLTMLFAERLMRLAGQTGMHVLTRLSGVVLAALAVQFVLNGITGYLHPEVLLTP
ncbi:NAAT family transporter [bacterium]|nr:MAG: NAAT family transporter [bacterium]